MSIPASSPFIEAVADARSAAKLQTCREIAMAAVRDGYIMAGRLDDMKRDLSRMLETALRNIADKYRQPGQHGIYYGYGSEMGLKVADIYPQLSNINSMLGKARTEPQNPYLREIVRLCEEMKPWADLVGELKGKVAKRGDARLQTRPAQPVNPNQVRATCAVCFRNIAVTAGRGTMAAHGYTRPEIGWQTSSCLGTMYKPYQVSCEGTKAFIQALRNRIATLNGEVQRLEAATQVQAKDRGGRMITIVAGEPRFETAKRSQIQDRTAQIEMNNRAIKDLESKIASWTPTAIPEARR